MPGPHAPARRRRSSACLLLALTAALQRPGAAQTYGNPPVCQDGSWLGEVEPLANPEVQCFRSPPCIRWSWLTRERCKSLKKDEDYPTWDPHLPPSSDELVSLADTFRRLLVNKTVMFVGDSINGLVYQAAMCELARGDLDLQHASEDPAAEVYALAPGLYPKTMAFLERSAALTAEDEALRAAAKARGQSVDEKHGSAGIWLGGTPGKPELVAQTGSLVVPKGWHKYQESDMAAILSLADVVILNYALHYTKGADGQRGRRWEHYESEMGKLFQQLEAFATQPGKAAIFRETGAGHAVVRDETLPKPTNCLCAPLTPAEAAENDSVQYNRIIAKVALNAPHVKILPFYDLTVPRHDLHEGPYCAFSVARKHPEKQETHTCCDCTHLCHTPQLWRLVFHRLHEVLRDTMVASQPASG